MPEYRSGRQDPAMNRPDGHRSDRSRSSARTSALEYWPAGFPTPITPPWSSAPRLLERRRKWPEAGSRAGYAWADSSAPRAPMHTGSRKKPPGTQAPGGRAVKPVLLADLALAVGRLWLAPSGPALRK